MEVKSKNKKGKPKKKGPKKFYSYFTRTILDKKLAKVKKGSSIWKIFHEPENLTIYKNPKSKEEQKWFLEKLMNNMFHYGRGEGNWTWKKIINRDSSKYVDFWKKKRNWNVEKNTWDNCDGFNISLKCLAEEYFGFKGIIKAMIGYPFITVPTLGIDKKWVGNVRTFDFHQNNLQMFRFQGHIFLKFHGEYFDVATNTRFNQDSEYIKTGQKSDIKWCDLIKKENLKLKLTGWKKSQYQKIENENSVKVATFKINRFKPKLVLQINENQYCGWALYLIIEDPKNDKNKNKVEETMSKLRQLGKTISTNDIDKAFNP